MHKDLRFKYILFDFDGTLIDTNELIIYSLQETAKAFLGRTLSQDDLNSILGKYLADQMKCLSEDHCDEMVAFYRAFYKKHQDSMIKEYPGVTEMLKALKALGCKIAVVSAKGRGGIEHGLDFFNMRSYIDVIISAYDIQNNKPHPEPAQKALQALDGECENSLMIGDSPYDILCGQNAGIKSVLVDWSIFPREQMLALSPDYIIKTPGELIEIVKY